MIFRSNRFLYLVVSLRGRRLKGKGKAVLGKGVLGARETRGACSNKLQRKWTVKNVIVISIVSFQMASLRPSSDVVLLPRRT